MTYHTLIFLGSLVEAGLVLRWLTLEQRNMQARRAVRHELAVRELLFFLQHQGEPQTPTVDSLRPRCCPTHQARFDQLYAEARLRLAEEE